jgi:hypothetical protein
MATINISRVVLPSIYSTVQGRPGISNPKPFTESTRSEPKPDIHSNTDKETPVNIPEQKRDFTGKSLFNNNDTSGLDIPIPDNKRDFTGTHINPVPVDRVKPTITEPSKTSRPFLGPPEIFDVPEENKPRLTPKGFTRTRDDRGKDIFEGDESSIVTPTPFERKREVPTKPLEFWQSGIGGLVGAFDRGAGNIANYVDGAFEKINALIPGYWRFMTLIHRWTNASRNRDPSSLENKDVNDKSILNDYQADGKTLDGKIKLEKLAFDIPLGSLNTNLSVGSLMQTVGTVKGMFGKNENQLEQENRQLVEESQYNYRVYYLKRIKNGVLEAKNDDARESALNYRYSPSFDEYGQAIISKSDILPQGLNCYKQSLKNKVAIFNLATQRYVILQTIPKELQYNPQSNWTAVASMGRNNPFYIYTGSDDTISFDISWYGMKKPPFNESSPYGNDFYPLGIETVVANCRLLESWSKADGYNRIPPKLAILWGGNADGNNNTTLFGGGNDDQYNRFILHSAPYNFTHFQGLKRVYDDVVLVNEKEGKQNPEQYKIESNNLYPMYATQSLTFKRITVSNATYKQIQYHP